jgi:hypothetical protein
MGPWDFSPVVFFHQTTPPWYTRSFFEYDFKFAEKIDKVGFTAVSMIPLCISQWCQWHRYACHSSTVPMTPLCISQRCLWHHSANNFVEYFRELSETLCLMRKSDPAAHSTAVSSTMAWTAVSMTLLCHVNATTFIWSSYSRSYGYLDREHQLKKTYICKLCYAISITCTQKVWGLTKDLFLSQRCHWHSCDYNRRFHSRCSSRIRSHIQKGFSMWIMGIGGVVWWKKPEAENLVSGSL